MKRTLSALILLLILIIAFQLKPVSAKELKVTNPDLIRAIEEFNSKDFGAAETSLLKAKESGADSAVTLYYLGLTYKELLIFDKAISFLNDAAEETPGIKEAFFPLAEIYFHMGKPLKALSEIENAEKAGVKPGFTAYLKGLILMSRKSFDEAIKAFEKAKREDQGLANAAEYQINIAKDQLNERPE